MRTFTGEVIDQTGRNQLAKFDFNVPNDATDHHIQHTARDTALKQFTWHFGEVGDNSLPAGQKLDTPLNIIQAAFENPQVDTPYQYSTNEWLLFEFGAWLKRTKAALPEKVKVAGAYRISADDLPYRWTRTVGKRAVFKATE